MAEKPESREKFDELAIEMAGTDGVHLSPDGLTVHGKLFAFLKGNELVVELPEARATDLKHRGVAYDLRTVDHPNREWVRVTDLELWPELARESHEFVGEPPVGGQS